MKDNSYDQLLTLDQVVVQAGEYHLALTCLQDENKDTEQLLARIAFNVNTWDDNKKTHHCFQYLQVSLKSEDKNNVQQQRNIASISFHCLCMAHIICV